MPARRRAVAFRGMARLPMYMSPVIYADDESMGITQDCAGVVQGGLGSGPVQLLCTELFGHA